MLFVVMIVGAVLIGFLVLAAVIDRKARRRGRRLDVDPASVRNNRRRNEGFGSMYNQGGGV